MEQEKKRQQQKKRQLQHPKKRKSSTTLAEREQIVGNPQKKRTKKNGSKNGSTKKKRNTKNTSASRRKAPKKKETKQSKAISLLFNILFYVFILFVVGGSVLFATSSDENKSFLGYRFFGVLTDSMVPRDPKTQKGGFHSGDIIIVKDIPGESAEVGDIITFRPSITSNAFLTHRVKEKMDKLGETEGTFYITQGDANKAEDVPINAKQVVGKKMLVIPKVGGLLNFVQENVVVSVVFVLSVFGFITIIRYYFMNK
ncbi:signal peptidase I [Candidatus Enterococcus clewellii]|uniref:Signal peptidase I n=1 Tax=Candidatus Enterococcus clewellii TaxID=1834193 RepID=A0A242K649_9ENTE|nr:signal peptidase I [Enterococcus sp. 9E7_DIV0242]OTP14624.1 signal peptidase I [Enterococcus sp. 9E7_DIV0242]